jgi:hypothetical protein
MDPYSYPSKRAIHSLFRFPVSCRFFLFRTFWSCLPPLIAACQNCASKREGNHFHLQQKARKVPLNLLRPRGTCFDTFLCCLGQFIKMNKFFVVLAFIIGFAGMALASGVVASTGTTGAGAAVVVSAPVQTTQVATQTVAATAVPIVCPAGCIPSQGSGAATSGAVANVVAFAPVLLGAAALALF